MKKKTRAKAKTAKKSKAKKAVRVKAKVKKSSAKRSTPRASAKKSKKIKSKAGVTPRPGVIAPKGGVLLGFVEDYFAKIGVIALTLKGAIGVGQKIQVLGHTTNFEQPVASMQIDHNVVMQAGPRDSVGIKVIGRARCGDHVYLLK